MLLVANMKQISTLRYTRQWFLWRKKVKMKLWRDNTIWLNILATHESSVHSNISISLGFLVDPVFSLPVMFSIFSMYLTDQFSCIRALWAQTKGRMLTDICVDHGEGEHHGEAPDQQERLPAVGERAERARAHGMHDHYVPGGSEGDYQETIRGCQEVSGGWLRLSNRFADLS